MRFTEPIKHGLGTMLRPVHAGDDKLASRRLARDRPHELVVESPAFGTGAPVPGRHTKDGEDEFAGHDREALIDAMRGKVVACGDLVGTYERPSMGGR